MKSYKELEHNTFNLLTDEVLLKILSELDHPKDLVAVSKSNKRLRSIAFTPGLWKEYSGFKYHAKPLITTKCFASNAKVLSFAYLEDDYFLTITGYDKYDRSLKSYSRHLQMWHIDREKPVFSTKLKKTFSGSNHMCVVNNYFIITNDIISSSGMFANKHDSILIWDRYKLRLIGKLEDKNEVHPLKEITSIVNFNDELIVTAGVYADPRTRIRDNGNIVKVWDFNKRECIHTIHISHIASIFKQALVIDDANIGFFGGGDSLLICNILKGVRKTYDIAYYGSGNISALFIMKNRYIICMSEKYRMLFIKDKRKKKKPLKQINKRAIKYKKELTSVENKHRHRDYSNPVYTHYLPGSKQIRYFEDNERRYKNKEVSEVKAKFYEIQLVDICKLDENRFLAAYFDKKLEIRNYKGKLLGKVVLEKPISGIIYLSEGNIAVYHKSYYDSNSNSDSDYEEDSDKESDMKISDAFVIYHIDKDNCCKLIQSFAFEGSPNDILKYNDTRLINLSYDRLEIIKFPTIPEDRLVDSEPDSDNQRCSIS